MLLRSIVGLALAGAHVVALAATAEAAVACGQVITTNTTLTGPIGPCPSNGIVVGADNITLDLGGHTVTGNNDIGEFGDFAGILIDGRRGVTVRNGAVTRFEAGVRVLGGSGNTLQNLTVHDNIGNNDFESRGALGHGILIENSSDNKILNNRVLRNGRRFGIGVLGVGSDRNHVSGNHVRDTLEFIHPGALGYGSGIRVSGFFLGHEHGSAPMSANAVIGNLVYNNAGTGIYSGGNRFGVVRANQVVGNGYGPVATEWGVHHGIVLDFGGQRPEGPSGSDTRTLVESNRVTAQAGYGIRVSAGVVGNHIRNNDARGNSLSVGPWIPADIWDNNRNCASFDRSRFNVWENNAHTIPPPSHLTCVK